ncbi:MAG: RNA pseudouridine synthase [Alphaproteobacteria bacterium]|nr:RNA pseudouridine synthase [Alphaproteobacteria bacterium]MCB9691445.1 RNA pseudouridine synthase [Alphaproteobacteria bacterium]
MHALPTTIAKPAGLPVFPLHADPGSDCVLARLLADHPWRSEIRWPEGFAGGIAHRLDVPTSGALLVADDPDELARIREAFADRAFVKVYRLRTAARVPWDTNHCERPIAHARRDRRKMVVQRGASTPHRGQWYPADTAFARIRGGLFEARMSTGVMHQIRVHAAFLGIALEGDRLYGGAPSDGGFLLHHMGLSGPFHTTPVVTPAWAADGDPR